MYRPLNNKILITPDKVQERVGHIYSAELTQKKPIRGTVVSSNSKSELKEGDIVIYNRHAGQPITLDDKEYLLMSDDDIYFIENDK